MNAVAMLEDSDRRVREAALETLGKLEGAALAAHAAAVVAKLEDSSWVMRATAVATLGKLESEGLLSEAHAAATRRHSPSHPCARMTMTFLEERSLPAHWARTHQPRAWRRLRLPPSSNSC